MSCVNNKVLLIYGKIYLVSNMNIDRLKEIREDRDLLQKDVAEYLGIKQQQYSEYEIGKRLIPINYLSNLADFYNTSIDYLLAKTDNPKPYEKSILLNKKKHYTRDKIKFNVYTR